MHGLVAALKPEHDEIKRARLIDLLQAEHFAVEASAAVDVGDQDRTVVELRDWQSGRHTEKSKSETQRVDEHFGVRRLDAALDGTRDAFGLPHGFPRFHPKRRRAAALQAGRTRLILYRRMDSEKSTRARI